jgi:hypothetical protein
MSKIAQPVRPKRGAHAYRHAISKTTFSYSGLLETCTFSKYRDTFLNDRSTLICVEKVKKEKKAYLNVIPVKGMTNLERTKRANYILDENVSVVVRREICFGRCP